VLLLAAGCKPKPKEISSLQRKEAANLVSEANFAVTLHDYARAEPLLERAAKLCPDNGEYWMNLGITRRRQGNNDGAKEAYRAALAAARDAIALKPEQSEPRLQEVYLLALLGRADDARAALAKSRRQLPNSGELRAFEEAHQLDRTLADPGFKQIAL
ncbi:MAG TPA: tetratricopeptide repeat protein, partial [Opitutus sp.]|nr:tetratricopeptide repeat protein [Opitutus sp.]